MNNYAITWTHIDS